MFSEWADATLTIIMAIPQPLLFFDLQNVVEDCSIRLDANDTILYSADKNPTVLNGRVERDLVRLEDWIEDYVAKTQLMVFRSRGKRNVANSVRW